MLINLSNHPSSKWTAAQTAAAVKYYQKVVDMPFPNIAPEWSDQKIAVLAVEYAQKIIAKQPQAVHLMGEMTFTYALVNLLQKASIHCVASTSERIVQEEENNKKTVFFHFIQFRAYPSS